jgi:hypothetical protein
MKSILTIKKGEAMYTLNARRLLSFGTLCLLMLWAMSSALAEDGHGGKVLPAQAKPYGYSLDDLAAQLALFSTGNNNPQYYPQTPFQILFGDSSKTQFVNVTCPNGQSGVRQVGVNSFVVQGRTPFFIPLFYVDDSPPVLGVFPADHSTAIDYFFSPNQVGGRDFKIIVDKEVTEIGSDYLAGPVGTQPLLDGGGSHFIQLGAFLTPLKAGTHTVTIKAQVAGALLYPVYGFSCLQGDFSYVVKVLPGSL